MSEKETKSPLIQQGETLYPTQVRTEKDRVTDLTVSQDQSLERSNDTAVSYTHLTLPTTERV